MYVRELYTWQAPPFTAGLRNAIGNSVIDDRLIVQTETARS